MSIVPTLPEAQAAHLLGAYRRSVGARRIKTVAVLAAITALAILASWVAEVRPQTFATNLFRFTDYLGRIVPDLSGDTAEANLAGWYWGLAKWLNLLAETLLIAYLGTLIGAIFAFAACFSAAANLMENRAIRFVVRRGLEFLRTVPEVVFALLFVIAFGLGPMAGVLALGLHSIGTLGKLFSEVVENIDMRPVEGVRASGGSWMQGVRFGVLPQVAPNFASYALLRFEINVRGASVMGFVGAGGIGQELITAIRQFYYTDVSAILLLIILTVVAIDMGTERVRHGFMGTQGRHA
jgi:phosphonate transport system permease protein